MQLPLVPLLYLALGGAYLVVLPAIIVFYLKNRWYTASSVERLLMYFLVFLFFPGFLLLGPFLNFRPQKRQLQG
ncbi:MAG: NAD(P)H-quinone oxidoreductase subunit L [Leptolyngbyaceae cyanobacterium SL_7_1]|nr:NAD(P)H-quinone oxidoreductase subunit L [Leptolyngbyaceae cyanobacterium SL_7_1]